MQLNAIPQLQAKLGRGMSLLLTVDFLCISTGAQHKRESNVPSFK